jgi:hypothetical protein
MRLPRLPRKRLLVPLAGFLVLTLIGVSVLWPRQNRITRENYDRIRFGMSRAEVEAILGLPGDHSTMDSQGLGVHVTDVDIDHSGSHDVTVAWISDGADVWVFLNPMGKVVGKQYIPLRAVDHGPLGNLRWRAKRQWHRWFP